MGVNYGEMPYSESPLVFRLYGFARYTILVYVFSKQDARKPIFKHGNVVFVIAGL